MNTLLNYLHGRLGKRTCPIVSVEQVYNCSFNSPWREWLVIKFKDGTKVELIEKPREIK